MKNKLKSFIIIQRMIKKNFWKSTLNIYKLLILSYLHSRSKKTAKVILSKLNL